MNEINNLNQNGQSLHSSNEVSQLDLFDGDEYFDPRPVDEIVLDNKITNPDEVAFIIGQRALHIAPEHIDFTKVDAVDHIAELQRDLEEARNRIDELKVDTLTGLPNRAGFYDMVEKYKDRAEWQHAYVFLDLDGLKIANEFMGHEGGDALLKILGNTLKSTLEDGKGFAGRFGGDEFVLCLDSKQLALAAGDQAEESYVLDATSAERRAVIFVEEIRRNFVNAVMNNPQFASVPKPQLKAVNFTAGIGVNLETADTIETIVKNFGGAGVQGLNTLDGLGVNNITRSGNDIHYQFDGIDYTLSDTAGERLRARDEGLKRVA